jgi:hypothetical protein
MDTAALLTALAPYGVTGIAILDPADPSTWRFDATPPLTAEQRIDVVALIQAQFLVTPTPTITKRQFFAAITPDEYAAARAAATAGDNTTLYGLAVLEAVPTIDLTDPLLQAMLDHFVTTGIVTAARVQEITAAFRQAAGLPAVTTTAVAP